jgi:hypothetical protein
VLESRALLSGGVAAVHAATQHAAALHPAQQHTTLTAAGSFQGTVVVTTKIASNDPAHWGAKASLAGFGPTAGTTVSARFQVLQKSAGETYSITGTFKGTITTVTPDGIAGFLADVQPTGGSVTVFVAGGGLQQQKYAATPDGSLFTLRYAGGRFQELIANDVFSATAPIGYANQHLKIDITLSLS